jgi:glycosyltransferase involved in cell wall biosynthesis
MHRLRLGRNVVAAILRNRPDYVFLPSADEQLLVLPLLVMAGTARGVRGVPIEAVIHHKSYTSIGNARDRFVSASQRALLKSGVFTRLNFVNFLHFEDVVSRQFAWAPMARAAGDPVPQPQRIERVAARRALGLETDGRCVGMVGGLDERKAVSQALAAFRAARLSSSDRFLLAGKLTPEYRSLVWREYEDLVRTGRLVVLDRYLTEQEMNNAFAALDLHCSVYSDFSGLSSLMLKSLAAGVPVVADDQGWTRAVARRFGVGRVVNHRDVESFARGMTAALEDSAAYKQTRAIDRLLRFHSIPNFVEGLVQQAGALNGKAPTGETFTWSWVMEALPNEQRQLR